MNRISIDNLVTAEARVRAMTIVEKTALADELYRLQPNLLASCLVQPKFGVSLEKLEFLIELVLISFEAMRLSGHSWPLITEDEQERQLTRLTGVIGFGSDLPGASGMQATKDYLEAHPEQALTYYVQQALNRWLQSVTPEESDKYVALAAMNLVNCIAFSKSDRCVRSP